MGLSTTNGISCNGSMCLCPALMIFIWGKQTTSVPGILACPWYQLRTVPGMSPDTIVLGEGRLSFGRNTQQDCSSSWKNKAKKDFSETDYHFFPWCRVFILVQNLKLLIPHSWLKIVLAFSWIKRKEDTKSWKIIYSCKLWVLEGREENVWFWSVNLIRKVLP